MAYSPARDAAAAAWNPRRLVTWVLRGVAFALGIVQAWTGRYVIFSDGISYLEIADAYLRRDWVNAINAYWSPFYAWLLAIFVGTLRPDAIWSVPLFHALNFLSYLVSLAAFEYFLTCVAQHMRLRELPLSWLVLGYSLVVWSGLTRITIHYVSPDILVTAIVYWVSGILLQLHNRETAIRSYVLLGVALGIGYLTKGVFFVLAIAFYLPASIAALRFEAVRRTAIALAAFIAICAPFVAALSVQKGRLTFGETGRLNYSWEVLGAARSTHWQGEPGNLGTPQHPTRKVHSDPDTYVFPSPIAGTYPPWYDPSYWYEGIKPRLSLGNQLTILRLGASYTLIQLAVTPGAILLITLVVGNVIPHWLFLDALRRYWFLLFPSAGAILSYCLVFVDRRYIAGFLIVFTVALWATVYERLRNVKWVTVAIVASAVMTSTALLLRPGVVDARKFLNDFPFARPERSLQAQLARAARDFGMRAGEPVAYIGLAISADWLRLNGNRVVGEITVLYDRDEWPARRVVLNERELIEFWDADPSVQEKVFNEFKKAGAQWVAADYVPEWANTYGWYWIGGAGVNNTFVRRL